MYDKLLFPTDSSEGTSTAFDHALDVAATHDATVHVLNVVDTSGDGRRRGGDDAVAELESEGEQLVSETAAAARERGVDTETAVERGNPYRAIVDYANAEGIDLITMPTHGRRGLERFLLGSTTERVVRRADVPVLTIRPHEETRIEHPYRNVLVPTDGSACAEEALTTGIEMATVDNARLHLLSVIDTMALGADVRTEMQLETIEESANRIVDDAADLATERGIDVPVTAVEFGSSIPNTVLSYVDEHEVDLLVVGTHGRTGFDRYLLGSVTEKLIRTSPVPVLTVREPAEE
ncbi:MULTISPECIES: universal stress protein [Halolamina]|uniref:Nucleotide-binding universal stress protein, UspA family n=1 Tax=Halolamina pelagica TaxID=699431 RepID=A0A1I5TMW7_9EURY|nr:MULTISPECIES: universal stress protein [Halolamina]NHX37740.1 universal stress protein [Halolamina sp. R1-12]SFP84422.1 Nucleotide-binding universal stress protein, UspA family [Halolamina pelagica]